MRLSIYLLIAVIASALTVLTSPMVVAEATNTTEYYIQIQNVTIFQFNVTGLSIGFVNESHIIITYTCMYQSNYSEECTPLRVEVYDDTVLKYTLYFTNLTQLCGYLESVCSGHDYVNVTGFSKIVLKVYNNETNELLQVAEVPIPYFGPKLTGYLTMLYYLLTIGLFGGLAARGSMKTIGLGFIVFGIVTLVLPYIGIYPPYQYVLFVFAIIVGLILLWYSKD